MTSDKGIPIKNVYYMLTYAFQELRKNNYEDVEKEDFENIQDMFAEILYKGMSHQLKQGLHREYILRNDTIPTLRGKLDINGTIRNQIRQKRLLACEYDELSENNIFNQIIKTTASILMRERTVKSSRKHQIKSIMPFLSGVDELNPFTIKWSTLRFQRSNQTYKMLLNICYFVLDGMLLTTESGGYRMASFSDEHMSTLFEKFVLEFYKYHYPNLSAHPDQISWNYDVEHSPSIEFLPSMKTDITLHNGPRTLIIDTKYYGHMMQEQFDKQTIHSGNLYQIFTYVKNLDKDNTGLVSGILLYARTQESVVPDLDATFGKNRILVRTLDLNCDFSTIDTQLKEIVSIITQ